MLEVVGLTRRFGGLIAVNNVTLSVAQSEIRGLIGPNGAGKTTLFNLLTGVLRPTAGLVRFEGTNITGESIHRLVRRGIVRTYQLSQLFAGFTVYRNVLSALHVHARSSFWAGLLEPPAVHRQNAALAERALEIVRFVGLNGREEDIAGNLSHGHKRLLQVAVGLAPTPRLLLLDEPVAGLLHEDVDRMMGLVQRLRDMQGITVVLVEHNMQAVMRICDRVTVLQFGAVIAEGTPAEIAANPRVIEAYLGVFEDDAA
jgi:branched-chain amino acid transport system ATP-binding protein